MSADAPHLSKVGTVAVSISDSDRALEFYVDKLGLEKRVDAPFGEGYRWIEVAPPGADTTIALAPPPPGRTAGNAETGIALNTDDIDRAHASMRDRGIDVDGEVMRMGGGVPPMFWFRDLDSNSLLVVESR